MLRQHGYDQFLSVLLPLEKLQNGFDLPANLAIKNLDDIKDAYWPSSTHTIFNYLHSCYNRAPSNSKCLPTCITTVLLPASCLTFFTSPQRSYFYKKSLKTWKFQIKNGLGSSNKCPFHRRFRSWSLHQSRARHGQSPLLREQSASCDRRCNRENQKLQEERMKK